MAILFILFMSFLILPLANPTASHLRGSSQGADLRVSEEASAGPPTAIRHSIEFPVSVSCREALTLNPLISLRGQASTTVASATRTGSDAVPPAYAGTRILGLPVIEGWTLVGGIATAVVLIFLWLSLRSRRRSSTEDAFDSAGRLLH